MQALTIEAAAKINWTLDITGTDARGYHLLDTIMQKIALFDTVHIKKTDGGIRLACSSSDIPTDERNTAYQAAQKFLEQTALSCGCEIYIEKRIPCGAGLGGGSADAAAVLLGLNCLFGGPLSQRQLEVSAAAVGADVPFLLREGAARAKGIGEKLTPLEEIPEQVLLCAMQPKRPAPTALVYRRYDALGGIKRPDNEGFLHALKRGDQRALLHFGGNVLQKAAQEVSGTIDGLLQKMKDSGALFYSMTGSGSAVFGVFETLSEARRAENNFDGLWHCVCSTVNGKMQIKQGEEK